MPAFQMTETDERRMREDARRQKDRDRELGRQQAALSIAQDVMALNGTKRHRKIVTLAGSGDSLKVMAVGKLPPDMVAEAKAWVAADRQKAADRRVAAKETAAAEADLLLAKFVASGPASECLTVVRLADTWSVIIEPGAGLSLNSAMRTEQLGYRLRSMLSGTRASFAGYSNMRRIAAQIPVSNAARLLEALPGIVAFLGDASSLPLKPRAVEEILGITASERLRWTKGGQLPVCGHDSFVANGVTIEFSLHPVDGILALRDDGSIARWRAAHSGKVARHRADGAKTAKVTLARNEAIRTAARADLHERARDIARTVGDPSALAVVKLAMMAVMCSRWAKKFQEKGDSTRKNEFYGLKDRALRVLAVQRWARVSYVPAASPKISVDFCDHHRDEFRDARRYYGCSAVEWAMDNRKWLMKCPECDLSEDGDYYALYDIALEIGDAVFRFHVPFGIGEAYLPPRKDLPRLPPAEADFGEGMFRFGRPVDGEEEITWPAKRLAREIEAILVLFDDRPPAPADA